MKERLRERLITVASAVGYPIFYVCCLVVFATWTFPFDKVRDRIVASFNEGQRASGSPRELAINEISSSWITGLKMTGVRFTDRDSPHEPGKETKGDIKFDTVVARIQVLPLLVGSHNIEFHAEAFGGKIDGVVKDQSKGQAFELAFEAVDLGQTPVAQALDIPMEGQLGGSIKLELPDDKLSKANGTIAIEATDVAVGDGKAKLMGMAVPRLNVGVFSLNADVKDGTMKISKLGASGKDVDLLVDGRITMHEQFADSFGDLNGRFRIGDAYRAKTDATKALFGAPGATVPGLVDMDPKMKQSKRPDGFYVWHARGTLSKMEPSPGGSGGPTSGPGGSGLATGPAATATTRAPKGGP
jgi:type II secretion system protein N